jgi:hypothetical protein
MNWCCNEPQQEARCEDNRLRALLRALCALPGNGPSTAAIAGRASSASGDGGTPRHGGSPT